MKFAISTVCKLKAFLYKVMIHCGFGEVPVLAGWAEPCPQFGAALTELPGLLLGHSFPVHFTLQLHPSLLHDISTRAALADFQLDFSQLWPFLSRGCFPKSGVWLTSVQTPPELSWLYSEHHTHTISHRITKLEDTSKVIEYNPAQHLN